MTRRRSKHPKFNYEPDPREDEHKIIDAAYHCGRDLDPDDKRAEWIDDVPGALGASCISSYHAGQAERYEQEAW